MFIIAAVVALIVVLLIAGILIAASLQPGHLNISRSITTSASPGAIHAVISDLNRWPEWSPYQKFDPAMKTEYTGSPGTIGSSYSWNGNDKVGSGRLTVTDIKPNQFVEMKLEFFRPWKGINKAVWRIDEVDGQRQITWSMECASVALMPRIFSLIVDMDNMIGTEFANGLATLKGIVEKE